MTQRSRTAWTFVITSLALFMGSLDNLVVTTALPVIRRELHANLSQLEWTINAYTLTFAVLLLTGAALGDRFGRRRIFAFGLLTFTLGSAAAALAPSPSALIAARAFQGAGAAAMLPLTLTLLSAAVRPERRGLALGAWGGIGGLAIAVGPIVGGAVVQGISWQWIFWLNVPIGLLLLPLARLRLTESHGSDRRLDLTGLVLASAGLFGIVGGWSGQLPGLGSPEIVGSLAGGGLVLAASLCYEWRASSPCSPCASSSAGPSAAPTPASLLMSFGMLARSSFLPSTSRSCRGCHRFPQACESSPGWPCRHRGADRGCSPAASRDAPSSPSGSRCRRRALLDWPGHHGDDPVWRPHPALCAERRRHGPVLRPGGECGAQLGAPRRGGQGVGRQQRHPSGQARRRRAGVDLRPHRRVRLGDLLRPGPRSRHHGGGGRRRRWRRRRPVHPRTPHRAATAETVEVISPVGAEAAA